MAKGLDKHLHRQSTLNAFGKDLARRSKGRCEMCGAHGTPLQIHEVPPVPSEPDFDHCILLCENCTSQLDKPKNIQPDHWRCLNTAVWSEIPAVQVIAVHTLKHLSDQSWAIELQEQLYLTPEIEAWLERVD